jgi:hypothetical protein
MDCRDVSSERGQASQRGGGVGLKTSEGEVRGSERSRKLGSKASPARNATVKVSGVDWNSSWPRFKNTARNEK